LTAENFDAAIETLAACGEIEPHGDGRLTLSGPRGCVASTILAHADLIVRDLDAKAKKQQEDMNALVEANEFNAREREKDHQRALEMMETQEELQRKRDEDRDRRQDELQRKREEDRDKKQWQRTLLTAVVTAILTLVGTRWFDKQKDAPDKG